MINYTEKGSDLHNRIRQAGHWLRQENGEWLSSDDTSVQLIIDTYSLTDLKNSKKNEVLAYAKKLRDRVIASISPGEMASWPIKLSEAMAFAAGSTNTPMLSAEAAIRGITVAEMVGKVGGNATSFSTLEAQIGGTDGRHRDNIDKLTTFEEVIAYDYSTGWPVV